MLIYEKAQFYNNLSKLLYRLNVITIKISTDFFVELNKLILKYMWNIYKKEY